MRAFLLTITMGFRMYFRDRSSVFWGLLFPLLFMVLIGLAFGRGDTPTFAVRFVDHGGGPLASGLRQGLGRVPLFKVADEADEATALDALRQGRATLVVVVPSAAAGDPVRVYFDQARVQDSQTALMILERFVAEANLQIAGVSPVVRLQATGIAGRAQMRFFDFLLPGILAMTVMQTGLMGVTWVVAEYRQRLILKRILSTPVHPFAFLGGLVGRYTVTNLVQMVIIVAVAILVFDAKVVGSPVILLGLIVLGTLAFVGLGFAISTVSKTPESANLMGSVLHFPMMFLGGTFWPREFMPQFMQPFITLLPFTPLVEAMRAVSARGETLIPYLPGLAYLGAWGLVAFALAAWRFKWE